MIEQLRLSLSQPINNAVIVLGEWQRDSALYIYVSNSLNHGDQTHLNNILDLLHNYMVGAEQ